ncbi:MAG TPA: hypothetical protein VLF69_03340 [Candidatus Saccharimonadales bacterium]|nr:hypothetical protein [Candidatus Saccharimonadales bacterium]
MFRDTYAATTFLGGNAMTPKRERVIDGVGRQLGTHVVSLAWLADNPHHSGVLAGAEERIAAHLEALEDKTPINRPLPMSLDGAVEAAQGRVADYAHRRFAEIAAQRAAEAAGQEAKLNG